MFGAGTLGCSPREGPDSGRGPGLTGGDWTSSGDNSEGDGGDGDGESGSGTGGDGTGGDASGSGSGSDTDSTGSGTGDIRFDVGSDSDSGGGPAGDGGQGEGCDKIDFLFVVDNSGSMSEEQDALIASFPGFVDAIVETVDVTDFHILSADTDSHSADCQALCSSPSGYCNRGLCSALPEEGSCEGTLGAGRTIGLNGEDCGIEGGNRYILPNQTNLTEAFACAARQGGGDQDEQQVAAIIRAISPELVDPGGCNEGFLRDDAILVITVITDENDTYPGTPQDWKQAIVDRKSGDENAIVFLAIDDNSTLRELALTFANAYTGEITAADYAPFFLNAIGLIDATCEDFVPPG